MAISSALCLFLEGKDMTNDRDISLHKIKIKQDNTNLCLNE